MTLARCTNLRQSKLLTVFPQNRCTEIIVLINIISYYGAYYRLSNQNYTVTFVQVRNWVTYFSRPGYTVSVSTCNTFVCVGCMESTLQRYDSHISRPQIGCSCDTLCCMYGAGLFPVTAAAAAATTTTCDRMSTTSGLSTAPSIPFHYRPLYFVLTCKSQTNKHSQSYIPFIQHNM